MIVLGIETSCDDTGVCLFHSEKGIISNVVSSQVKLHAEWGGVYPDLAAREHTRNIIPVLDRAVKEAKVKLSDIDAIAVTVAPGLIVSLVIGISSAKALSWSLKKPLIPVHHIEAHIFAIFIEQEVHFPFIALVVSGGHTELYIIRGFEDYLYLGGTLDDAAGEAYDKVARILGLGYPGGPIIDSLAKKGREVIKLPRPLLKDRGKNRFNFSFSGLKTAVMREAQKGIYRKEDIAHSFQEAVVDVLVGKTVDAVIEYGIKNVVVAGGVSANSRLRERFQEESQKTGFSVYFPPLYLCTDNGAMIAYTGYRRFKETGRTTGLDFEGKARLRLDRFVDYIRRGAGQ
ncbi:tRNA (adenosine(37)-N6)-threonylcarbamoyltransferase complex transferase subunit TsaD [Persephonella atlantica]|uniref:tRNA N6-adenosine threonylcarbamoyltransferase n=1 Tax=Persephonella atlantica TaxID=2699429 RepID=A0ABS1GKB5_9AQUI|nr:tRNA (adenosine(37)-N6)-threonylcarbamoyltransferase complex transferase subunit TsaD [Persephonella atlantica]MBK3333341.1 tRNA (adenosine(37)-N6)-threonylcarbamoyltransferase complex transferase subunit TsaD [Persephonella atlantica]